MVILREDGIFRSKFEVSTSFLFGLMRPGPNATDRRTNGGRHSVIWPPIGRAAYTRTRLNAAGGWWGGRVCGCWQVVCIEVSYITVARSGYQTLTLVSTTGVRPRYWPGASLSASSPAIIRSSCPITAVRTAQVSSDFLLVNYYYY